MVYSLHGNDGSMLFIVANLVYNYEQKEPQYCLDMATSREKKQGVGHRVRGDTQDRET